MARLSEQNTANTAAMSTPSETEKDRVSFYKHVNETPMTKKERLVAQYLLDNRPKAGFMTASGIARELGISDVTVIRFARKMGYAGFTDLQEALQQEVVEKLVQSEEQITIPKDRLERAMSDSSGKSLLQLAVDGLVENTAALVKKNSDEIFERAAQIIMRSRRKVVAGFRSCSASASSLATRLSYMLDDVYPVIHEDPSCYSPVFHLKKGDCLIVIGFEEYQKNIVSLVKQAQKCGATVIALTDKETSPLAFCSEVCIYCSIKGISFNSFTSLILACEVIAAHIVKLLGTKVETRNRALLDHMIESGYYWDRRPSDRTQNA